MGKILLFNMDKKKQRKIGDIAAKLGHSTKEVSYPAYGKTLGTLADIKGMVKGAKPYAGPRFEHEMMVFSGLDSDSLDDFLAEYKSAGLAPVERKAVITATNVTWTAAELFEAINEENEAMKK